MLVILTTLFYVLQNALGTLGGFKYSPSRIFLICFVQFRYICLFVCKVLFLVDTRKRCIFSTTPTSQGKCILPCHCTKGCDTRTGACIGGGHCMDGHPSQYKWHGPACQTGEWNSFTYTPKHTHAHARTYTNILKFIMTVTD